MPDGGYEARDYGQVALLLDGWAPDPIPSSNWRGTVEPNRVLTPPAQPSGKTSDPTVVVGWRIEYHSVTTTFEDLDDNPVRSGDVVLRCSLDPGAGSGIPASLFGQLASKFATDDGDEGLTWLEGERKPQVLGVRGAWWVEELRIPFMGG